MSKSEVSRELSRMDAEDAHDNDAATELDATRQRQEQRDEAERKRREADQAEKTRASVVNMYDMPEWRHASGRCQVVTSTSWRMGGASVSRFL